VSRKCYIHPVVLDAYMDGETIQLSATESRRRNGSADLTPDECAVVALIERRLNPRLKARR
jgi:DNA topoisomerase-1